MPVSRGPRAGSASAVVRGARAGSRTDSRTSWTSRAIVPTASRRAEHADVVAEEAQRRRPGDEGEVADRGDDRHPGPGPGRVVGAGAHADGEAERDADAPDRGADEGQPGVPKMTRSEPSDGEREGHPQDGHPAVGVEPAGAEQAARPS